MISRLCVVQLALGVLIATPLASQTASTTRGFVLGAHLVGASLDLEDGENDGGAGIGISAAYGFRSGLAIFLNASGARMNASAEDAEDYTFGQGDLGVRYTFGATAQHWRPFLAAALSGVSVSWENVDFFEFGTADVEVSGPAFSVGGGVKYFLNPRWALDGNVLWSSGSFDQVKIDNVTVELDDEDEVKLNTVRLQFGFQYHFAGRNQ